MLLMIDNYDSFTYNLVQYFAELGETVEVHRNDKITVSEIAARHPERLVISPGPCSPDEAGISVTAIRELAGQAADPRRLSRPPERRPGLRRADRAGRPPDARQDQPHPP